MIDRLRTARLVCREVGAAAEDWQRRQTGAPRSVAKADGSVVTDGDREAEALGRAMLSALDPSARVLGEEGGGDPDADGWIIDPVDGTENYARRSPFWGTLVAYRMHGEVRICALVAPALRREWHATLGGGAFCGRTRLSVSDVADPSRAAISFGGLHEYGSSQMAALLSTAATTRVAWGIGNFLGHALVAEGSLDLAISVGTSVWDVAAPSLLVREAGGDANGPGLGDQHADRALITSNGRLGSLVREARDVARAGLTDEVR